MKKPAIALEGVLKEELARLKEAEKSYLREIRRLPKGSFQKKKIKGILYAYRVYRKGNVVVRKYLGRFLEAQHKHLREQIKLRQKYEKQLRAVRQNQKRVLQMIHGRKRAI